MDGTLPALLHAAYETADAQAVGDSDRSPVPAAYEVRRSDVDPVALVGCEPLDGFKSGRCVRSAITVQKLADGDLGAREASARQAGFLGEASRDRAVVIAAHAVGSHRWVVLEGAGSRVLSAPK